MTLKHRIDEQDKSQVECGNSRFGGIRMLLLAQNISMMLVTFHQNQCLLC